MTKFGCWCYQEGYWKKSMEKKYIKILLVELDLVVIMFIVAATKKRHTRRNGMFLDDKFNFHMVIFQTFKYYAVVLLFRQYRMN